MGQNIGIYELKTHISKILREVSGGARYTITHRGKPVGELLPPGEVEPRRSHEEAWDELWEIIQDLQRREPVDPRSTQALIDETRR